MGTRRFRLARRLAKKAVKQSNQEKWDAANRIMARAVGGK